MATCTAPVEGHRSSSAAARCPACRGRSRWGGGYSRYSYPSYSPASYSPPSYAASGSSGGSRGGGGSGNRVRARWSRPGSVVLYTPGEVRALTPIRETVEKRASASDARDVFLCHAWDDRQAVAKELCDLLTARNVSVWFSENDIGLGEPFLRAIDKGLAKSRIGIVLVTPALLKRLPAAGVADKELSVLLARDQLVPIVHKTTYEELREVSPMLASRNGLDTAENTMAEVAAKLAELIALPTSE
jgi:hypothetical protein